MGSNEEVGLLIQVSRALRTRAKIAAARGDTTLVALVTEALVSHLDKLEREGDHVAG